MAREQAIIPHQESIQAWGAEVMGEGAMTHRGLRLRKVLEEAAELVQAGGLDYIDALTVVEEVYRKPPEKNIEVEFGGVIITVSEMAALWGVDLAEAAWKEFKRCHDLAPKIATKARAYLARLLEEERDLNDQPDYSSDLRPR